MSQRLANDLPADDQTLSLWRFDAGESERFQDFRKSVNLASDQELEKQRECLLEDLKRAEAELAAHPVPLAYSGVRREPDPTVVFLRGDVQKPGAPVSDCGIASPTML